MSAHILLYKNGVENPLGANKSMVVKAGDVVRCIYADPQPPLPPETVPSSYEWQVVFTPLADDGTTPSSVSQGVFTDPEMTFTPDNDGAYLVRLICHYDGLPDSTQYVRVRVVSHFSTLEFVAAGERYDQTGRVPADIDASGWTNQENRLLQRMNAMLRRTASSGRILYVDANRGREDTNEQNDLDARIHMPGWAEALTQTGWVGQKTGIDVAPACMGDFSSINAAIAWADSVGGADVDHPWTVVVRPGYYRENLNLKPHIYVVGEQAIPPFHLPLGLLGDNLDPGVFLRVAPVIIETDPTAPEGPGHVCDNASTDMVALAHVLLLNSTDSPNYLFQITGGSILAWNLCLVQGATGATIPDQGGALALPRGYTGIAWFSRCFIVNDARNNPDMSAAIVAQPSETLSLCQFDDCEVFSATNGVVVNPEVPSAPGQFSMHKSNVQAGGYALHSAGSVTLYDVDLNGHGMDLGDPANNDCSLLIDTFGQENVSARPYLAMQGGRFTGGGGSGSAGAICVNASGLSAEAESYVYLRFSAVDLGLQNGHFLQYVGDEGKLNYGASVEALTIGYQPEFYPPGSTDPTVPPEKQLTDCRHVQDALDELARRSGSSGGGGVPTTYETVGLPPYTLTNIDPDQVALINNPAGSGPGYTVTLPATGAVQDGTRLVIKDMAGTAGGNPIQVTPAGTDSIDGSTSPFVINAAYGAITLIRHGGTWYVV